MNIPRVHPGAPALRPSTRAVRAAMLTMAALAAAPAAPAQDAATDALTLPTSTVEAGIGRTSSGDAKAHEYDGLKKKGAFFVGSFDLRGGGRWDGNDASRWRIWGLDLGTDSRSLGAEHAVQGTSRFSVVYDELQRNRSDSYRTPLLGAGGNVLTLPSNWLVPLVPRTSTTAANARGLSPEVTASGALVNGVLTAPTAAMNATAAAIQAADLPAFHGVALGTKRTRLDFNALLNLGRRWDVSAQMRHEDRQGLKPMGTVTRYTNADIATIIPDLVDQSHDQLTLAGSYAGDELVLQGSYVLSSLVNHVPSMSWAGWATPGSASNVQTMSSAPSNRLQQLAFNGNYRLGATTRLSGSISYGRGTQDTAFLTDTSTPLVPTGSLHGLVVNKAAQLRLASRPLPELNLAAAYRYDERDNRTPVYTYGYYDAGELRTGTSLFNAAFPTLGLGSNANLNANRAYSRRLQQLDLDADYRVQRGHLLRAGVQHQDLDRWCNGSWVACVDANNATEHALRLEYVLSAAETLSGRVAVTHAQRKVDYNENAFLALVPMANVTPTGAPAGSTAYATLTALGLTGWGPALGLNPLPAAGSAQAFYFANNNALANALYGNQNRISELPGMRRYDMADRTRDKLRSALTWQADEAVSVQATLDLHRDRYTHSVYGLQNARGWAATLDASWAVGEDTSLAAYATREDQRSRSAGNSYTANSTATSVNGFTAISGGCFPTIALRNASNKIDPCLDWKADNRDRVSTVGLAGRRKGLAGGRLDISAALTLSSARTANDTLGGNYANNPLAVAGAPAGTVAATYIAATPLPDITTKTVELRAGLRWRLDDTRAVRAGYVYQRMRSSDWSFDGLQPGGLAGVLPTYEQSPRYTAHTFSLSYLHSFR